MSTDCGPLTPPENGKVDTSPGTQYMDTAAYTCMDGYQLEGSNTRVCQSNGSWEGLAPECVIRGKTPGPEVIKLFPCSTQLSAKFILLLNVKMPTIVGILTFISRINTS